MTQISVESIQPKDPFGPTAVHTRGVRLNTSVEPDNLIKTHCCFCGQQCGIQLKVKDNEVIGFEPCMISPSTAASSAPKG